MLLLACLCQKLNSKTILIWYNNICYCFLPEKDLYVRCYSVACKTQQSMCYSCAQHSTKGPFKTFTISAVLLQALWRNVASYFF